VVGCTVAVGFAGIPGGMVDTGNGCVPFSLLLVGRGTPSPKGVGVGDGPSPVFLFIELKMVFI